MSLRNEQMHSTETGQPDERFSKLNPEFPDVDWVGLEEYEQEYRGWIERDKKVQEIARHETIALEQFVERYTGSKTTISVAEHDATHDTFTLPYTGEQFVDILPADYVYTGGVARAALERTLGTNLFGRPRDIDIGYVGTREDTALSCALAQKYMSEDFQHGHGVKPCGTDYFETRDFTLNEVYFTGANVVATRQCILDTLRGIVRFSEYEKGYLCDEGTYQVKPKLLAKAVRFISADTDRVLGDAEHIVWEGLDTFHAALHLGRALEQGADVAGRYVDTLIQKRIFPEELREPEALRAYLGEHLYHFLFQYLDCERSLREGNIRLWEDYESDLPKRASMHKPGTTG